MELSINRNTTELVKNNYFVLCGCSRFFYAVCALLHFPTRIYIVVTVMTDAFVMRCYILTILKLAHLLRKCILCIRLKSIRFNSISAKKRALRRSEKKYTEAENRLQLHIDCFSMLLIRAFPLPLWRIFIFPKTSIKTPILVYLLSTYMFHRQLVFINSNNTLLLLSTYDCYLSVMRFEWF